MLTRLLIGNVQQRLHRVLPVGLTAGLGQLCATHPVVTMDARRRLEGSQQRLVQPDEHWHLLLAYQIRSDQGVSHARLQRHIAGHHSHRAHGAVRVVEGHDERDRIIRSGVGVDHEAAGPVSHRVASPRPVGAC